MNKTEIFKSLCAYDERNPFYKELFGDEKPEKGNGKCYCDNCFRGRDILAREILRLIGE